MKNYISKQIFQEFSRQKLRDFHRIKLYYLFISFGAATTTEGKSKIKKRHGKLANWLLVSQSKDLRMASPGASPQVSWTSNKQERDKVAYISFLEVIK